MLAGVGLGVAYQDDGEHVHLLRVKLSECCQPYGLLAASGLPDKAYWGACLAVLQEYLLQPIDLPISADGFWIIDGGDEVAFGCSFDASLNLGPRCHQV